MVQVLRSQIDGEFEGYDDGAVFKLMNGQAYQQSEYKYLYHYAYCPAVSISRIGSRLIMEVSGISEAVSVVPVDIIVDDVITSDFNGFNGSSVFQFQNGQVWEQAEYKYNYHYSYRPRAMVVSGLYGTVLHVEGMSETVRVKRIK